VLPSGSAGSVNLSDTRGRGGCFAHERAAVASGCVSRPSFEWFPTACLEGTTSPSSCSPDGGLARYGALAVCARPASALRRFSTTGHEGAPWRCASQAGSL
jgi:hypothetical protein